MNTQIIKTEKMVSGGNCLTKIDGKNIFVPQSLPNEKLAVTVVETTKDYDIAEIVEILEPSPNRVKPFCPYYGKCGGCSLQIADAEYQRTLRKEILAEIFVRNNVAIPTIEVVYGSEKGYRNRFQFHNGGLKNRRGNEIVQLSYCPLAHEEINGLLASGVLRRDTPAKYAQRVHVFGSEKIIGEDKILYVGDLPKAPPKTTGNKKKNVKTGGKRTIYSGTTISQDSLCTLQLLDKTVQFDVRGFFQSNLEVLEKTIPLICEDFYGDNLLDMYSGVGTLSLFASSNFNHTTLVEHNRDAVVYGEYNLQGIPHESYGLSGEKWIQQPNSRYYDGVLIDPPRSGMEKSVLQWLIAHKPKKIRSLSCDPVTHGRDCAFLVSHGYAITRLVLTDFYPQTSHIESLAFLEYVGNT